MSDLKLFRIQGDSLVELEGSSAPLERGLQTLFERNLESFCRCVSAATSASAKARLSLGGTTHPVSPTMNAASPTSVVTHGVPQAMASASTLGNASPKALDNTCTSRVFMIAGMSFRGPRRYTYSSKPASADRKSTRLN